MNHYFRLCLKCPHYLMCRLYHHYQKNRQCLMCRLYHHYQKNRMCHHYLMCQNFLMCQMFPMCPHFQKFPQNLYYR
jgi:hypothetical protein